MNSVRVKLADPTSVYKKGGVSYTFGDVFEVEQADADYGFKNGILTLAPPAPKTFPKLQTESEEKPTKLKSLKH